MKVREISPELAALAKAELNEDTSRTEKDLQSIKDWLSKQRHINARTDDQWLVSFLRGCKFSLERTKEKLDNYYAMKSALPEISTTMDPMDPKTQELLSLGVFLPLLKTSSPDAPRIILVRPGRYDPSKFTMLDTMKVSQMFSDIMILEDDVNIIAGQRVILDFSNVGMGHFSQMTPTNVKRMVATGQDAVPVRQKGTHHLNTPAGFETVFNIFKMFMSEKNKNRTFVHNQNMEELFKYVPQEILPEEYGGKAGSIQDLADYWKKKMESYRDHFIEDRQYKSDESKRPGKPKNAETLFGIDGSFRQLSLD